MIVVGLTGSIAMGKSEAANIFRSLGVPVFDSDAEVHQLYSSGGAAVAPMGKLFPAAIVDGAVDRRILSKVVLENPQALRLLESVVHPLVRSSQMNFLDECRIAGAKMAVLDIPLLFETGRENEVDVVVVVSAPPEIQRARALQRPGMTAEKLDQILMRQLPDAQKRGNADFIVDTSQSIDDTATQLRAIVVALSKRSAGAKT